MEASWAPLGASWGVLGASWGVLGASCRVLGFLEASWAVLEASWAVLVASWGVLGVPWGHLGQNIEKRSSAISFLDRCWMPKWMPKSSKNRLQKSMCFPSHFFKHFFQFLNALPNHKMVTCAGRTFTKHRLGAQKSRFAWDRQVTSLSRKDVTNVAFWNQKLHQNEIKNQVKSGLVRSCHFKSRQDGWGDSG